MNSIFHRVTIHELIIAIVVVLSLVVLLIMMVLLYSFYKYKVLHQRQIWLQESEQKVTQAIVSGEEVGSVDEKFIMKLRNPSFRNIFLSVLVASDQKFSGGARNEVNNLFKTYKMEDAAWQKIRQKKAYVVAGGILELAVMRVESALPYISSLLEHPKRQVYQEAQYAVVSFKGFDGLDFLNTLVAPLSDWQQLRLLRSIGKLPVAHEEWVKNWLSSSNQTVIIFTLRLIRKFQLLPFYADAINLFDHRSVTVKVQAIRTIIALENVETINQLIAVFFKQPIEAQIEILRALKKSRSPQSTPFLQQQLWHHPAISIKIAATEALIALKQHDYLQRIATDETVPEEIKQVIKHALQEKT
ncbi:HEAT repeat domain-containing protein [Sphingobacterium olei]|uniref:HEAT repeat domain-containing protein n=1 Tax=Sphingobacterium olei TaxID=2571155 RepID=A0A4U0P2K6_9SPHI|nr:HEAT repeat domain-containing protein [Sphingobacterium olei]TJZ61475.1 HEAT repeat domain-containing protein [Sphingobacterium olei]